MCIQLLVTKICWAFELIKSTSSFWTNSWTFLLCDIIIFVVECVSFNIQRGVAIHQRERGENTGGFIYSSLDAQFLLLRVVVHLFVAGLCLDFSILLNLSSFIKISGIKAYMWSLALYHLFACQFDNMEEKVITSPHWFLPLATTNEYLLSPFGISFHVTPIKSCHVSISITIMTLHQWFLNDMTQLDWSDREWDTGWEPRILVRLLHRPLKNQQKKKGIFNLYFCYYAEWMTWCVVKEDGGN